MMKKIGMALVVFGMTLGVFAAEPVLEFKLNEGQGAVVKDVSGTVQGKVIFPANTQWKEGRGEGSQALFFNGDPAKAHQGGTLLIEPGRKIDFSKPFTVMFYLYLDPKVVRKANCELVSRTKTDKGPGFRILFSWNRLCFFVGDGQKRTELNTNSNKVQFTRGVWHHVAVTCADGKAAIYHNGIVAAESAAMMPVANVPGPIFIGSYKQGYAYHLNGGLSELKFFDSALSAQEILAIVKNIE